MALDDLVSFIKAKKEGAKPAKEVHAHETHDGDEGLRAAYYRKIIERYAEVIMGFLKVRLNFKGLRIMVDGLVEVAFQSKCAAEIIVH